MVGHITLEKTTRALTPGQAYDVYKQAWGKQSSAAFINGQVNKTYALHQVYMSIHEQGYLPNMAGLVARLLSLFVRASFA